MKPDLITKTKIIAQKNQLWALIKRLGDLYGEDEDFIREFAALTYEANKGIMDDCIKCFQDLVCQAESIGIKTKSSKSSENAVPAYSYSAK